MNKAPKFIFQEGQTIKRFRYIRTDRSGRDFFDGNPDTFDTDKREWVRAAGEVKAFSVQFDRLGFAWHRRLGFFVRGEAIRNRFVDFGRLRQAKRRQEQRQRDREQWESLPECFRTLGTPTRSVAAVRQAYRKLAGSFHPDRGGDVDQFRKLIAARDEAIRMIERPTISEQIQQIFS